MKNVPLLHMYLYLSKHIQTLYLPNPLVLLIQFTYHKIHTL